MEFPNRKRNRLEQYDYSSPGAYFVTICTHNKEKIFGEIVDGDCFTASQIKLSEIGFIANEELLNIEKHYENVKIDKYVIMPNHIHILLVIAERMNPFPTTIKFDLSNIIGKYKASVTRSVGKAFMPSEKINYGNPLFMTTSSEGIRIIVKSGNTSIIIQQNGKKIAFILSN